MILNALCKHDISTDDHTDCLKRGGILRCPMTCTDFESRTEGIQDTVMTAIDEAYKRGYRDGQMDLRKEQEATQRYWGKKSEKCCATCEYENTEYDKQPCKDCGTMLESATKWTPKKPDEIKVGDEVISDAFDDKGIVTHITDDKVSCISIILSGSSMMRVGIHGLHKTGRYFPQVAEVLKQMQENENE